MAYRLKASYYVNNCPVSDNAYFAFAKRIMAVVHGPNCELMLQTLNKYLEGDRLAYADDLDEHLRRTFEMLRFDIDKAIERSARARAIAKKRARTKKAEKKQKKTLVKTTKQESFDTADSTVSVSYENSTTAISSNRIGNSSAKGKRYSTERKGCVNTHSLKCPDYRSDGKIMPFFDS